MLVYDESLGIDVRVEHVYDFERGVESHDFGEAGNFYDFSIVIACNYLFRRVLHDDETLSFDANEVFLIDVEKLFSLSRWKGELKLLKIQCLLRLIIGLLLFDNYFALAFELSLMFERKMIFFVGGGFFSVRATAHIGADIFASLLIKAIDARPPKLGSCGMINFINVVRLLTLFERVLGRVKFEGERFCLYRSIIRTLLMRLHSHFAEFILEVLAG